MIIYNRIVAGITDACVVVESAKSGGSLITARISQEYNREVFAFPGRFTDKYSEGCNNLIRDNRATLITDAEQFLTDMDGTLLSISPCFLPVPKQPPKQSTLANRQIPQD